jgi:RNA exonuclease 4
VQGIEREVEEQNAKSEKIGSYGIRLGNPKGCSQFRTSTVSIERLADSQVTDARATMGLYRLHKVEWEASVRPQTEAYKAKMGLSKGKEKRKRDDESDEEEEEEGEDTGGKKKKEAFPGGGRRGVSSGLSVIVRRGGKRVDGPRQRGVPRPSSEVGGAGGSGSWWEDI